MISRKITKFVNLWESLLIEESRSQMIDYHSWKFYKFISPYQIKFFPSFTHKLIGQGRLPSSKNKLHETNNACEDFFFRDLRDIVKSDKSKNINIILKGLSKTNIKKIDNTLTTYIINMNYDSDLDNFDNVIQLTCDMGTLLGWLGHKNARHGYNSSKNKIIYLLGDTLSVEDIQNKPKKDILEKFYKRNNIQSSNRQRLHVAAMKHKININKHSMGTGMWAIIYLINRYNFVNIYGWNQYRNSPLKNLSFVEFIKETWSVIDSVRAGERKNEGGTFAMPKKFFCSLLISYIYAFKIVTDKPIKKRIKVDGYINNIDVIAPTISILKKIIYK